jgi:hypothetical protein
MDAEDAKSLQSLTEEFGLQFGPEIFETIQTEYNKRFPDLKPAFRSVSSVQNIVENILWCIHPSIERAISSGDEKNAGDIAYNAIIRKFYITLFLSKYYETVPGTQKLKIRLKANIDLIKDIIFPILFESQTKPNTWLCVKIDQLIEENKTGFPALPEMILGEAESAREAVVGEIRRRRQEQMQLFDNPPMTLGAMSATPLVVRDAPLLIPPPQSLDEDKKLQLAIREAILDVERSGKFDLNDFSTHDSVFKQIFDIPPFDSMKGVDTPENRAKFEKMKDIFYRDINSLLLERQGAPPAVVFPPGIFTPGQLKRRDEAEKKGWTYGPKQRGGPDFFPGGSKKIKSKKNSKMRSKRRLNTRRRRRNSYK